MALHTWISIQSDFGITLGKLGRLAGGTDENVIGSTLMALKDIVALEASSGESQFMTGKVETSAFGTFAISASPETKIVMQYIISVDRGDTVEDYVEKQVQKLCTHFGRQITITGVVDEFARSGASIPAELMRQAFINAATIVQLDENIETSDKLVKRQTDTIVNEILRDNTLFSELIREINYDNILNNVDNWHNGFIKQTMKEELLERAAHRIIFRMIEQQPLLILKSESPRDEFNSVKQYFADQVANLVKPDIITDSIAKSLKKAIRDGFKDYVNSLSILDVHTARTFIYDEFVKRATTLSIEENPWIIFSDPKRHEIRKEYRKVAPEMKIFDVGQIFAQIVNQNADKHLREFIEYYYSQFISDMVGTSLTKPAIDVMMTFAQNFISPEQIREKISKMKGINENWKEELLQLISVETIQSLQIESIQGATDLSKAASSSIIGLLSHVTQRYFIGNQDMPPILIDQLSNYYYELGPRIKGANILLSLLRAIAKTPHNVNFLTPRYIDIIGNSVLRNGYRIKIGEEVFTLNKSKNLAISDTQRLDLWKLLNEVEDFDIIISDDDIVNVNTKKLNIQLLVQFSSELDLIVESVQTAIDRRIDAILGNQLEEYTQQYLSDLDDIAKKMTDGKVKDKNIGKVSFETYKFDIGKYNYGEEIQEIKYTYSEQLKDEIRSILDAEWPVIEERVSAGKNPVKEARRIDKIKSIIEKKSEGIVSSYKGDLQKFANQVFKEFRKNRDVIKESFRTSEREVMRYQYRSRYLLPRPKDVIPKIVSYQKSNYPEFENIDESIQFDIAVNMFENPPQTMFEWVYDKIINQTIPDQYKKIYKEAGSKLEFESELKEIGKIESSKLFNGFSDILRKTSEEYIDKDGIVSAESNALKLHLGRLRLSRYPSRTFINELLNLQDLNVDREAEHWLLSFSFKRAGKSTEKIPNIITLMDTSHYLLKYEFINDLEPLIIALGDVGKLVEDKASKNVFKIFRLLADSIFTE